MPASDKLLSNLFRSSRKLSVKTKSSSPAAAKDTPLKQFVTALDSSSTSPSSSAKPPKPKSSSTSKLADELTLPGLELEAEAGTRADDSTKQLSEEITSMILTDASDSTHKSRGRDDKELVEDIVHFPWFSMSQSNVSPPRREIWRERKQKWVFTYGQTRRFDKVVKICGSQLGTDATVEVFGKLGRETGVKEYNSLIGICVERARSCDDEDVAVEQICKAFQLLKFMKEKGFQLEEETYCPLLRYFIDMGMVEEFHFFCNTINNGIRNSVPRLGYYEMLLWIKVNDEEKIRELCAHIAADNKADYFSFQENYLFALCESDRKNDLLQLLETIEITKVSSLDHLESVFKFFGRLLLESCAQKYLLALRASDHAAKNVSSLIFSYTSSIPNLKVDSVVLKFKDMHAKLEITPSSASYEKLIAYSCDLLKVHVALEIVDEMLEEGLVPSVGTINSVLYACEESNEFNLVRQIYSMICHHHLKPNGETFRSMISLSVKLKDFDGAYSMLDDLKEMKLNPTPGMYNAIMGGYFRKKDMQGALMVLKQMELANVKPDSQTFGYLIHNSSNEKDIIKYYEKMKSSGVQVTKQVFMSLINAYATCGDFEKAKQVVLDEEIPVKSLSEIKSVLVSALASHGQMSDALNIYEEIKQAGFSLEPKAVISLIEYLNSEEELSRLIQLLEELHDPDYWIDGCCRLIMQSIRYKNMSSTFDLLKQLKDKINNDELTMGNFLAEMFCQIAEIDPPAVEIGLDLLQFIKDDLGLSPSRKCLDFLLCACANAKDLESSRLIWKEYQKAGLPYNVLSYLWMYKVLLASGDHKSANKLLTKMPKDDPHVPCVIQACKQTYIKSAPVKGLKESRESNKD